MRCPVACDHSRLAVAIFGDEAIEYPGLMHAELQQILRNGHTKLNANKPTTLAKDTRKSLTKKKKKKVVGLQKGYVFR